MFEFILTNVLMLAGALVLLVVVRSLPRIEESMETEKQSVLERWIVSGIPEKIDMGVNSFLEKFLRRFRVVLMKTDNAANTMLKKVRHEPPLLQTGQAAVPKASDFKEVAEAGNLSSGIASGSEKVNN